MMTPSSDLVECTHCDCWFAGTSLDDLFFHGTGSCRVAASPPTPIDTSRVISFLPSGASKP